MLQLLSLALLLYPAYQTHKALRREDPELTRRWLQWWVVLTVYKSVQLLTDLALSAMPIYSEVKLLGLVYLVWDEGAGGQIVFEHLVGPLLKTHEREIDAQLERAKGHAAAKLGDLKEAAVGALAQKGQARAKAHGRPRRPQMLTFVRACAGDPRRELRAGRAGPREPRSGPVVEHCPSHGAVGGRPARHAARGGGESGGQEAKEDAKGGLTGDWGGGGSKSVREVATTDARHDTGSAEC